ncbi:MAG TPA: hypothetical protein VKB02_02465 [Pyrinomonadaceae bacterium]|nr:hypothetical protein [Pyrinomonadaceae bacterium]
MTSFTIGRLHEQALLFNKSRPGLWGVGRLGVIGRSTKKGNGFVGVELSDLLSPETLKVCRRELPRLNPPFAQSELFRGPTS